MTKITELNALPRTDTGKEYARKLRNEGRIPAVLYGKDMEPKPLSLDVQETEYLFQRISVENTILDLRISGEKGSVQSLVREVQTHPHKAGLLHVDFLRIQKGVAVEVEIPISLDGVPIGVKESGGVLEQVINELRVKCIPSKIPEVVSIDVTGMAVGDSIHVSEVDLGEGVEILVDPERTICNVAIPRVVAVEEEEEAEVEIVGETPAEPEGDQGIAEAAEE
jgi:large subunit ribosomal protein L25